MLDFEAAQKPLRITMDSRSWPLWPSSEVSILLFRDLGCASQLLFGVPEDVSCASAGFHPTSQDPLSFTMVSGGADPFGRRGSWRGRSPKTSGAYLFSILLRSYQWRGGADSIENYNGF